MSVDHLPPLPSPRALTAKLRALNEAYSHPIAGPTEVCLVYVHPEFGLFEGGWRCVPLSSVGDVPMTRSSEHHELVPGDCFPDGLDAQLQRDATGAGDLSNWDATAAARRLLAAARDVLSVTS